MTITDEDTPAFMTWPLPHDLGTPRALYGETEAHLWQAGRCGICGGHQDSGNRKHALDHDHDTGLVRGLLCTGCNLQEGLSDQIVFHRWRSGMNPCAIFGWNYEHRGAFAPLPITEVIGGGVPTDQDQHAAQSREYLEEPHMTTSHSATNRPRSASSGVTS